MNGISTGTSNHDFFSQVGNGYLLGEVEAMQDDDYNSDYKTKNLFRFGKGFFLLQFFF